MELKQKTPSAPPSARGTWRPSHGCTPCTPRPPRSHAVRAGLQRRSRDSKGDVDVTIYSDVPVFTKATAKIAAKSDLTSFHYVTKRLQYFFSMSCNSGKCSSKSLQKIKFDAKSLSVLRNLQEIVLKDF